MVRHFKYSLNDMTQNYDSVSLVADNLRHLTILVAVQDHRLMDDQNMFEFNDQFDDQDSLFEIFRYGQEINCSPLFKILSYGQEISCLLKKSLKELEGVQHGCLQMLSLLTLFGKKNQSLTKRCNKTFDRYVQPENFSKALNYRFALVKKLWSLGWEMLRFQMSCLKKGRIKFNADQVNAIQENHKFWYQGDFMNKITDQDQPR